MVTHLLGRESGLTAREAEDPEALQEILKILDGSFQYDANVEMPADFSSYFEHLVRKPGQTLLNYVTDHDDRLKQIENDPESFEDLDEGHYAIRDWIHVVTEQQGNSPGRDVSV